MLTDVEMSERNYHCSWVSNKESQQRGSAPADGTHRS